MASKVILICYDKEKLHGSIRLVTFLYFHTSGILPEFFTFHEKSKAVLHCLEMYMSLLYVFWAMGEMCVCFFYIYFMHDFFMKQIIHFKEAFIVSSWILHSYVVPR